MPLAIGDRFLACPGGRWHEVRVTRLNGDGTINAQPSESRSFLDHWESITPAELSPDDRVLWPAQYARIANGRFDREALHAAINARGSEFAVEAMHEYWAKVTAELFAATDPASLVLDEEQAYRLIIRSGFSAKTFAGPNPEETDLYRLYWNGVRMGGRESSEVPAVTLGAALDALGLDAGAEDPEATAAVLRFEHHHEVRLPKTLVTLFTRVDCLAKLNASHCNSPEPQSADAWTLERTLPALFGTDIGVRIMLPHQGDHAWWAVFSDGADDARIAISFAEDAAPVRLVAHSLPFFFWDLRQSGRNWEETIAERG